MHDGPARHRQHVPDVTVRSSRPLPADHGASRRYDSRPATRPSHSLRPISHSAGRPELGTRRTLSSCRASSAFRAVRRHAPCQRVVHADVSLACGACVCRRRAIGGSEARETGCRRCRASPGNAQHLHFVACEGVELPEVPGRVSVEARAVSWAIGCVLGDRGGDGSSAAAEAVMMWWSGAGRL